MSHISLISIIVADYDEAIDYFTNLLGFDLVEDSPAVTSIGGRPKRWVVVRPPGQLTGILLAKADGAHQLERIGDQFAGRVGLFLTVEDFDRSYQQMGQAGVQFVSPPRSEPYGQVAIFTDISGNRWDLLGPAKPLPS